MIISSIAVMNTISYIPNQSPNQADDNLRLTQSEAVNSTIAPAW